MFPSLFRVDGETTWVTEDAIILQASIPLRNRSQTLCMRAEEVMATHLGGGKFYPTGLTIV